MKEIHSGKRIHPLDRQGRNPVDVESSEFEEFSADGDASDGDMLNEDHFLGMGAKSREKKIKQLIAQGKTPDEAAQILSGKTAMGRFFKGLVGADQSEIRKEAQAINSAAAGEKKNQVDPGVGKTPSTDTPKGRAYTRDPKQPYIDPHLAWFQKPVAVVLLCAAAFGLGVLVSKRIFSK